MHAVRRRHLPNSRPVDVPAVSRRDVCSRHWRSVPGVPGRWVHQLGCACCAGSAVELCCISAPRLFLAASPMLNLWLTYQRANRNNLPTSHPVHLTFLPSN